MSVPYSQSPYFKIGRATELSGKDYYLYRAFEILPAFLAWGTLIGTAVLSAFHPAWIALFIIVFDLYWLLKTVYIVLHHVHNWRRMKHLMALNWHDMLSNLKYEHIYHLIVLPYYKEPLEVIQKSLESLVASEYDKKKMIVVLAHEERAGDAAYKLGLSMQEKYKDTFGHFLVARHPDGIAGELAGKGSNISYATEQARVEILDKNNIPYEHVIVSAFDIDTVSYPNYFLCVTWNFLTTEKPYLSSYQPVPLYNNNIWEVPAFSRVSATSGTFWQMVQQERPEQNVTFSSHSIPFKPLYDVGYWQKNMVSEDSRIFWNLFFANNGNYKVVSLSYPVSLDANATGHFLTTLRNIYKQQRRWMWGVENVPYILFNLIKNKAIPLGTKIRVAFTQIEGFWSLATNPIMILLLGWLPLVLGGKDFNTSVLSYNLPMMTQLLMTLAMSGLILSAVISISLLPPAPKEFTNKWWKWIPFAGQWVLVPLTLLFFGALPGLDAQTRLAFGKYMGFWVTPKEKNTVQ